MKIRKLLLILPGALFLSGSAFAVQINWGSFVDADLRDSMGVKLDDSFAFQLGFFQTATAQPFVPTAENVEQWAANWKVFDQATFNPATGYFASTEVLNPNGTSNSPDATNEYTHSTLGLQNVDFSNQQAYIWTYNSTNPIPGSEWFLATDPTWVIPDKNSLCCDSSNPLEWSILDLDENPGTTPIFGKQFAREGAGEFTTTLNTHDLQTFTFIPEPSSSLLILLSGVALALRRRR